MLSESAQKFIEKTLTESNLVDPANLAQAKNEATTKNTSLLEVLVQKKLLSDEDATKLFALANHIPYIDLDAITIDQDVLKLISPEDARENMSVAYELKDNKLYIAMIDPENLQVIDFLARKSGYPIVAAIATKDKIEKVLGMYQNSIDSEVQKALGNEADPTLSASQNETDGIKKVDTKKLETIVQDAPITRALNSILEYAINSGASDIHIEPREKEVKIRFRIDGILQEVMKLPKSSEAALVSRIKILSKLKIDEHRIAQDGQSQYKFGNKEVDLRIAIAPISFGEQVVIRILDKTDSLFDLKKLGLLGPSLTTLLKGIKKPHGMILATGPTGSGKSTTLYAIIQEIISPKINIVTLEDPVEYKMDGVNQIQVNSEVGLSFASGLRSILRQDPNVIMVGEIRDHETADLAVQSSLTGHLVLSTLHTNNASGVLPRLLDMKIEPYLIASTINTCMGQRLVRKICTSCIKKYPATDAAVEMINKSISKLLPQNTSEQATIAAALGYENLPIVSQNAYTLYKGVGCNQCQDGFKGRIGLYEVFEMNADIEKLLLSHGTASTIQAQAQADGMITIVQDGILKALNGITTLDEVARVASE